MHMPKQTKTTTYAPKYNSYHSTLARELEARLSAAKSGSAGDAMSLVKGLTDWAVCVASFSSKCAGKIGWDGEL